MGGRVPVGVGMIRIVVILAIKSEGHWQFACMHPHMICECIYNNLYLSNLPTHLISKAFKVIEMPRTGSF